MIDGRCVFAELCRPDPICQERLISGRVHRDPGGTWTRSASLFPVRPSPGIKEAGPMIRKPQRGSCEPVSAVTMSPQSCPRLHSCAWCSLRDGCRSCSRATTLDSHRMCPIINVSSSTAPEILDHPGRKSGGRSGPLRSNYKAGHNVGDMQKSHDVFASTHLFCFLWPRQ